MYAVFYFIRHLADQTLMTWEVHGLVSAGVSLSGGHTRTERMGSCVSLAVQELSQPMCLKQEREGASCCFFF